MKVENIIFCDDIRQEVSNKITLVGCYNDRIRLTPKGEVNWPINVRIGIYLQIKRESNDPLIKKFKLEIHDPQEVLATIEGELQDAIDQRRPIILAFVAALAFKREGSVRPVLSVTGTDGTVTKVPAIDFDFGLEIVHATK